ncbi:hypothetical protein [Marinifilum caeruleilacunae]|uniref:hypothetical protein n=1 Tax=Marinifilum caeruleilacunae TaxID=2499076 RepID=UPI001C0F6ABC|nr:hypothetical protein [Marinifilum caeruleilacunae]
MEPIEILIFTAIAILAIVVIALFIFFSKKAIIKRKLKKSELKRLSRFRSGETAKIVGKVEFVDPPLKAPLTHRKCSHYHVKIEEKKTSGNNSRWVTLVKEEKQVRYLIKDGIKYAYINDSFLKSYIVQDAKYSSGFWTDPTENVEHFLSSKGIDPTGFFGFNKTFRCKEGILEENEEIAVYGHGEWKDAAELALPAKYGKVLEITATGEEAIYLSDDPDTTEEQPQNHSTNRRTENARKGRYRK